MIRIFQTGVNAIQPNQPIGYGGWVSGDVANLALSAAFAAVFDLGPDWQNVEEVTVMVNVAAPSTGFSNVATTFSDTPALENRRRPPTRATLGYSATFGTSILTTNGPVGATFPVAGRYLTVAGSNADAVNATGPASAIILAVKS